MAGHKLSDNGLKLIQGFEGFHRAIDNGERAQAYRDAVGVLTIGWGHTRTVSSEDMVITRAKAEDLLRQDVASAESAVNKSVSVALNQNQFDGLVSFVFNLGATNFRKSTLLKKLNNGNYAEVPSELLRWVNAGGKPLPGLVRRRKAEATLFEASPADLVEVSSDGDVFVRSAQEMSPESNMARAVETVNELKPLAQSRTMQAGTLAAMLGGANVGLDALSQAQAAVSTAQSAISQAESQVNQATGLWASVKAIPAQIQGLIETVSVPLEQHLNIHPKWVSIGVWVLIIVLIFRMLQARVDDRNKGLR